MPVSCNHGERNWDKGGPVGGRSDILWAATLLAISLAIRLLWLGTTFESSDNAELAGRILLLPGYAWMLREHYGVLINLLVKLFVGTVSSLGATVTEFWWKAPIALAGSLQAPVTFYFLKRMGCGRTGRLAGAASIAVLPVHVMQSRYLWGYEVLGTLSVTLSLWTLVIFLERPSLKTGLLASLCAGVYLISHGYILPFIPSFVAALILLDWREGESLAKGLGRKTRLLAKYLVWVFPLLMAPLATYPLRHAFSKEARLGFFLMDHLPGFIANLGVFIVALMAFAVPAGLVSKRLRSPASLLFALCGAFYLAPLFFAAPPDVTLVRGYMLVGACFWVFCVAAVLDQLAAPKGAGSAGCPAGQTSAESQKKPAGQPALPLIRFVMIVCFMGTLWGTIDSVFARGAWFDPSFVQIERGVVGLDPGTKAAGYLVRKYVPASAAVFAIHRAIEPPDLFYYFNRREYAWFDLSIERTIQGFPEVSGRADVVICERGQRNAVERDGIHVLKTAIYSEGEPVMWIYARLEIGIPVSRADTRELNRAFDAQYAPKVKL